MLKYPPRWKRLTAAGEMTLPCGTAWFFAKYKGHLDSTETFRDGQCGRGPSDAYRLQTNVHWMKPQTSANGDGKSDRGGSGRMAARPAISPISGTRHVPTFSRLFPWLPVRRTWRWK